MSGFAQTVAKAALLVGELKKRSSRTEKLQQRLDKKMQEIVAACRTPCLKAIEQYNLKASLRIVPEKLRFSFGFKDQMPSFSLEVELQYPSGLEPDEELEFSHTDQITQVLRPLIDKQLNLTDIRLIFDSITVPVEYYSK